MGAAALLTKLIPLTAKTAVSATIKKVPGVETVNDKLGIELEEYLVDGASEFIEELTKNTNFNREYTKALKASVKESIEECFNTSFRDDEIPDLIKQISVGEYKYDDEAVKADVKRHISEVLKSAGYTQFNTSGIDDASLDRFLKTVDVKMNAKINTNEKLQNHIMALYIREILTIIKNVDSKSDIILTLSNETYTMLTQLAANSKADHGELLVAIRKIIEEMSGVTKKDEFIEQIRANKEQFTKQMWDAALFLHNKNDAEAKTLEGTYIHHDYKDVSRKNRGLFALERTDGESEDKEDIEAELCRIISNKIKKTIFVTGEPGIGKSSLVAFLANEFKDDIKVIIMKFKSLNKFFTGEKAKTSIEDAIDEKLCKKIINFNESEFYTIILDGFDEFSASSKNELLRSFCKTIKDSYENISLIVTSRYSYNNSDNNIVDAFSSWYIIKKFNNKQI